MKVEYKKNDPRLGFAFLPFLIPAGISVIKGIASSAQQKKAASAAAAAAKIQNEKNAEMLKIGLLVGIPSLALILIFKGKKNDRPIQYRKY
jgi:hypothetical protein